MASSVFMSADFVNPTFGNVIAATLGMTGAITRERLADNSDQIVLQSTVPEGRAHEAPFMWHQGGATFAGEWDPVMYLGYNANKAITTEPSLRWVIEGNYNNGTRNVEAYLEYSDAISIGSGSVRPFMFFKNDKTVSVTNAGLSFQINAEQTVIAGTRAAPMTLLMRPINANQPANIAINGSGTGDVSNQYLVVAGGANESKAAYLRLYGNTSTSGTGNKGVVQVTGGVIANPTVTTQGIIALNTGASATERLRVQYDGLIAVNNPGVTASALLHVGAGTAMAGTAPLKLTAGVNNTTAEPGAMEYDGINLFFTRSGTTREGVITGVGAYKIARGATALDGSNPTTVATGLASVVSFATSLRRTTAVNTGTAFLTNDAPSNANVDVYGWGIAGSASTGTETFDWVAVGT